MSTSPLMYRPPCLQDPLHAGGAVVYSSPHYNDYAYIANSSNYSTPVNVHLVTDQHHNLYCSSSNAPFLPDWAVHPRFG